MIFPSRKLEIEIVHVVPNFSSLSISTPKFPDPSATSPYTKAREYLLNIDVEDEVLGGEEKRSYLS